MNEIKQQIKAKELVEEVLSTDIRARNNDLWLILQVWQKKQQVKLFIPYEELNRMISPETITRVRRDIQNHDGRLVATDPVIFARRSKQKKLRGYYGGRK